MYNQMETTKKKILFKRMNKLYGMIVRPPYLEARRTDFITVIENHLLNMLKTKDLYRIYYTILPLEKHFKGVEEQTFISAIKDEKTYRKALVRIKCEDFQWYRPKNITVTQSIPVEALVNRDGMAVGRGLKTAGNVVFRCLKCGEISSTAELYWKHQETHGNLRVRKIQRIERVNPFKF